MTKYKKGDKVAVIENSVVDPSLTEEDILVRGKFPYISRTFYGKIKYAGKSLYADDNPYRLLGLEFPSKKTLGMPLISGILEGDQRMRKANFLERLLYMFISKKSLPKKVFYSDKIRDFEIIKCLT